MLLKRFLFPGWTQECSQAAKKLKGAKLEHNVPGLIAISLYHAQGIIRGTQTNNCSKFCSSMNCNTPDRNAWYKVFGVDEKKKSLCVPTIGLDGTLHVTHSDKCHVLADSFSSVSSNKSDEFLIHRQNMEEILEEDF